MEAPAALKLRSPQQLRRCPRPLPRLGSIWSRCTRTADSPSSLVCVSEDSGAESSWSSHNGVVLLERVSVSTPFTFAPDALHSTLHHVSSTATGRTVSPVGLVTCLCRLSRSRPHMHRHPRVSLSSWRVLLSLFVCPFSCAPHRPSVVRHFLKPDDEKDVHSTRQSNQSVPFGRRRASSSVSLVKYSLTACS